MTDENWRVLALCAQVDGDLWFPDKGASVREAKRICGLCDVQRECLEWAVSNGERFGIFGGLTERERRRLKRGQPISTSQRDDAAAAMVERIAELAVHGLTDRQIGVVVGWKADRVYRFRSRHGIDGGRKYRQRAPVGAVA